MNRIMSGRQTSSSRAEIEARYREDTAADMDAARAAAAEQGEDFARNMITEIAAVVRNFEVPSLDLAARAGLCAAADPHHRDAMIGIVTISPQAAADAFATIAAHLRGNYRVQSSPLPGWPHTSTATEPPPELRSMPRAPSAATPASRRCSSCSTRPARPESSRRRSPNLPPSASRWRGRWESTSAPGFPWLSSIPITNAPPSTLSDARSLASPVFAPALLGGSSFFSSTQWVSSRIPSAVALTMSSQPDGVNLGFCGPR